jgi:hypothetical protein
VAVIDLAGVKEFSQVLAQYAVGDTFFPQETISYSAVPKIPGDPATHYDPVTLPFSHQGKWVRTAHGGNQRGRKPLMGLTLGRPRVERVHSTSTREIFRGMRAQN